MKNLPLIEKLKYVGAGIIVLTAFALMFPQVLGFGFSLARLGTFILITVGVSAIVALTLRFVAKPKAPSGAEAENEN